MKKEAEIIRFNKEDRAEKGKIWETWDYLKYTLKYIQIIIQSYIIYDYINVFFMKIVFWWIYFYGYIFLLGQREIERALRCCDKEKLKYCQLKLSRNL